MGKDKSLSSPNFVGLRNEVRQWIKGDPSTGLANTALAGLQGVEIERLRPGPAEIIDPITAQTNCLIKQRLLSVVAAVIQPPRLLAGYEVIAVEKQGRLISINLDSAGVIRDGRKPDDPSILMIAPEAVRQVNLTGVLENAARAASKILEANRKPLFARGPHFRQARERVNAALECLPDEAKNSGLTDRETGFVVHDLLRIHSCASHPYLDK